MEEDIFTENCYYIVCHKKPDSHQQHSEEFGTNPLLLSSSLRTKQKLVISTIAR